MNTFDLKIVYRVGGPPAPIDIQLFGALYNTGSFAPTGSLIFQTVIGTVTVSGATDSFRALMERSKTQPFKIKVIRMKSLYVAQQFNPFVLGNTSVWGASEENTISPAMFTDPYQQDPLLVDVPVNFIIDGDRGIKMSINSGEQISMTLFIEEYVNPTDLLTRNN